MKRKLTTAGQESFETELNYLVTKNYGTRLTVGRIENLETKKRRVYFNYNKVFNILDKKTSTLYVRNIAFKDIYVADISSPKDLDIPNQEINQAINSEFVGLRDDLLHKILLNKEIVIRILKSIHITSAFLNKFRTIFNDLFFKDGLSKDKLNYYLEVDKKYLTYIQIIVDSGFAERLQNGGLKASNKFKKLFENNKKQPPSEGIEEAMYKIISENYDYIVYEMGLGHIKAYINIISSLYYLHNYNKLPNIEINTGDLYRIYFNIFGRAPYGKFMERVSSLVTSGVLQRQADSVKLAVEI